MKSSRSGGLCRLAIVGLLLCASVEAARGEPVTMSFHGVIDLSVFGGSASSTYEGRVSWDPAMVPDASGSDWARYVIDGLPDSVTAGFVLNGVDGTSAIEPFSRFEQTTSDLFLELFFNPSIDLDGGAAPDLRRVALDMWTEFPPAFGDVTQLPGDLDALHALERRRISFTAAQAEDAGASSDDVVVPEPTLLALLASGLAAAGLRRGRHAGGRG